MIVGLNGSGKFILLEILVRFFLLDFGDVLLEGKLIFEWKVKEFV